MTYIVLSTLQKFQVPIPPIEIQKEIVKILDAFTELEAELEVELEKRREQYAYYREQLLTFDNIIQGGGRHPLLPKYSELFEKIEWKKLEDVFEIRNGYTPSKANSKFWENGTIPWFRMEDIRINGRILSDSIQHITTGAVK